MSNAPPPPPPSPEVAHAIVWGMLHLRMARLAAAENANAMQEAA
jgi:hypothetical protein